MKSVLTTLRPHWKLLVGGLGIVCLLIVLLFLDIGSLVPGMSANEQRVALTPIGWHGLWHQPLYLPLEMLRSLFFKLSRTPSATIVRLPSALFGSIAILCLSGLLYLWHGARIAVFGGILFATASWTLHVSRYGGTAALYLAVLPALLLMSVLLQKHPKQQGLLYGCLCLWGVVLYIPGMLWLLAVNIWFLRKELRDSWSHLTSFRNRVTAAFCGLIWLPLLCIDLVRQAANVRVWLGLPTRFPSPLHYLRQFLSVFLHLFVRGPQNPELWLGRAPLLDVFSLCMCLIGIYFYASHIHAPRTQLLGSCAVVGILLIALNGPVGLSLLVPLLFLFIAVGIAYILRLWFTVFPLNPLGRYFGLAVIVIAIIISCVYNLRAYFVAWPNDPTTKAVFYLKD